MDNTLIIIFTSVISVLFLVFIIATYREIENMSSPGYKNEGEEGGPRAELFNLLVKLLDERDSKK